MSCGRRGCSVEICLLPSSSTSPRQAYYNELFGFQQQIVHWRRGAVTRNNYEIRFSILANSSSSSEKKKKKGMKKKTHPSQGKQCKLHARTPLTMKKETGLLYNTKLKHDRTSNMAKAINNNSGAAKTSAEAAALAAHSAVASCCLCQVALGHVEAELNLIRFLCSLLVVPVAFLRATFTL